MSAPVPQVEQVDGFVVAVDILCVVTFMAGFTALLFGADCLIAGLLDRPPVLVDFEMQRRAAPMLIGAGILLLGGIALLLLPSRKTINGEGGK